MLLPLPDSPVSATLSPAATVRVHPAQHRDLFAGGAVALGQAGHVKHVTGYAGTLGLPLVMRDDGPI